MIGSRLRHQLGGNLEQGFGGMAVVGILALALEPKRAAAKRLVGNDGRSNVHTAVCTREESKHCRAEKGNPRVQ